MLSVQELQHVPSFPHGQGGDGVNEGRPPAQHGQFVVPKVGRGEIGRPVPFHFVLGDS